MVSDMKATKGVTKQASGRAYGSTTLNFTKTDTTNFTR